MFGSAFAGAVVGDSCGYWVGRWGGWPVLLRVGQWFQISEVQLQRAREAFKRNAAQAVLMGRFVTLLRIFAGPLAGIAHMPYGRFLAFNTLGAALWAMTMVSLAFGLGQIIPLAQLVHAIAQFGLVLLMIAIGWIVLVSWQRSKAGN